MLNYISMIEIIPKPSALAAIVIALVLSGLYYLIILLTALKYEICVIMLIIAILWLMRILYYPDYKIIINPKQNIINLHYKNQLHEAKLKKFYTLGFGLTILILLVERRWRIISIFIDSIPINKYKQLKTYLNWH